MVNGHTSEQQSLPQAGLPQGSPLSPILFLFFNADLVQHRINKHGGSFAFVDDYNAWVTGPSAEANREGIQAIVKRAVDWEEQSGATFEGEKTVLIHFTRNENLSSRSPLVIKGKSITPSNTAKILGVIMDSELRYTQHIARAATKGLRAAMALRRLRLVSPSTARKLFGATVAPVVDYASNIWMHANGWKTTPALNRVQKIGAQAITGAFRTVAIAVVEAEAGIRTTKERHNERATKFWVNLCTLPDSNPLSRLNTTMFRRFTSPLQKIAYAHRQTSTNRLETIHPFAIPPWEERLHATIDVEKDRIADSANATQGIRIATSSSERRTTVGMGVAIQDTLGIVTGRHPIIKSVTVASRLEQNSYTAELAAIETGLKCLSPYLIGRHITIFTSNQGAVRAASQPKQQSGQTSIKEIYETVHTLRKGGNSISLVWVPSSGDFHLGKRAKEAARTATEQGQVPQEQSYQAKSTTISTISKQREKKALPKEVGKYSKELDIALPGKHTRGLYDAFKRREASILAQLRTGMARLNGYLHRIGAAESDLCPCGQATETIKHFLFRCTTWNTQRAQMLAQTETRRSSLSFFLGGKTASDPEKWTPNIEAVRATVKYAMATGRLETEALQRGNTQ